MRSISINSNIASLQAQRRLSTATSQLSSTFERLSSGQRINRASDDAAGLSIQQSLRADQRVFGQGNRNFNDGISLLSIADSTLSDLSGILTRLTELAEQSANGTYSHTQRKHIDSEAQALAREYYRLARTASFNGIKIFDGTLQGLRLQGGYGQDGGINSSLGGALGTGQFNNSNSYFTQEHGSSIEHADFNGDGILDLATTASAAFTVSLGNGDGSFQAGRNYTDGGAGLSDFVVGDMNEDGIMDIITTGDTATRVFLGNANGTFNAARSFASGVATGNGIQLGDLNGDGHLDAIIAGNVVGSKSVFVQFGSGDGSFNTSLSLAANASSSSGVRIGDINGDGKLDFVVVGVDGGTSTARTFLGNGDGTFRAGLSTSTLASPMNVELGDVNNDGILDMVSVQNTVAEGHAVIRLGIGNGTFQAALSIALGTTDSTDIAIGDLNGDGNLDLTLSGSTLTGGIASILLGNGNGTFKAPTSVSMDLVGSFAVDLGDLNGDGVFDLITSGRNQSLTVRLAATRDGISDILPFSLRTMADARQAFSLFNTARDRNALQRSVIGAFQSRVGSAINTLQSSLVNIRSAESRISDADIAEESANLVKNQIITQGAAAILANANQQPALALLLLGGK